VCVCIYFELLGVEGGVVCESLECVFHLENGQVVCEIKNFVRGMWHVERGLPQSQLERTANGRVPYEIHLAHFELS